jgi:hypothetical protein
MTGRNKGKPEDFLYQNFRKNGGKSGIGCFFVNICIAGIYHLVGI